MSLILYQSFGQACNRVMTASGGAQNTTHSDFRLGHLIQKTMLTFLIFSDRIWPQFNTPWFNMSPIQQGFSFMFLSDCCSVKASWVWRYLTLHCASGRSLSYFIWPINGHPSFHGLLTTVTNPTFSITIPKGKHSTVLLFGLSPIYSQPCCKVQATVQRPTLVQMPHHPCPLVC